MRGTHVIREVSTPGGTDAAGQPEAVIFYFVQSRSSHDTTHLHLFAKDEQVGHDTKMIATPVIASDTHAALDLVENEQNVILIAQLAEGLEKFAAEMIVTAFTLN